MVIQRCKCAVSAAGTRASHFSSRSEFYSRPFPFAGRTHARTHARREGERERERYGGGRTSPPLFAVKRNTRYKTADT